MTEKFYCVGCKEHYQLPVTEAVKKPSKGDSFRHSVVSSCPKGHKTTKICNKDDYDKYSSSKSAESPLTSGPSPAEFLLILKVKLLPEQKLFLKDLPANQLMKAKVLKQHKLLEL